MPAFVANGTGRARSLSVAVVFALVAGLLGIAVQATADELPDAPTMYLPFACGETWRAATYAGHHARNDYPLDFNNDRGQGYELNHPVLTSAAGTVADMGFLDGSRGNWVLIDHGDSWSTRYLHLNFIQAGITEGATVEIGDQIGGVGGTGGWPIHLHYEQLRNNTPQPIVFDGIPAPYVNFYTPGFHPLGVEITSTNGCNLPPPEPIPPTIDIVSPIDGQVVSGDLLLAAETPLEDIVVSVEFFINGVSVAVDTDDAEWSVVWDSTSVPDGPVLVTAAATNYAGTTTSAPVAIDVDNIDDPPTIAFGRPFHNEVVSQSLTVFTHPLDDVGVTSVDFEINGVPVHTDTSGADGWSFLWNTLSYANGPYILKATATDTAGQQAVATISVTVSNVALADGIHVGDIRATVVLSFGSFWRISSQVLVHDESENPRAGANVRALWTDGYTSSCYGTANGLCTITRIVQASSFPIGYTINSVNLYGETYSASSNHDADGDTDGTTVLFDETGIVAPDGTDNPPEVSLTAPTAGTVVGPSFVMAATADDDIEVVSVEFFAGGVSVGFDGDPNDGWTASVDGAALTPGTVPLTATATDSGGQTATSAPVLVVVPEPPPDDLPPSVVISEPANGSVFAVAFDIVAVTNDDFGVLNVEFFVDDSSIGVDSTPGDGFRSSWDPAGAVPGTHFLKATATDTGGNSTTSSIVTVVVPEPPQDDPPTVSLSAPSPGATVEGTVSISAFANDDIEVSKVEFFVDDFLVGTDTYGPDGWSTPWDTTISGPGSHLIKAKATDNAGQSTTTASQAVFVEVDAPPSDDPPTVSIVSPQHGDSVGGITDVVAEADDDIGVDSVSFYVDDFLFDTDTDGSDGWIGAWDTTVLGPGSHLLRADARDTSGNITRSVTISVIASNDPPPVVSITAPTAGTDHFLPTTIVASASDNGQVVRVDFYVNGALAGSDTNGADGWSTPWNPSTAPLGAATLTARAVDNLGLQASSAPVSVNVVEPPPDDPPTVEIVSPAGGSVVTEPTAIVFDAFDETGVTSVELFVYGASTGLDDDGSDGWSVVWAIAEGPGTHLLTAVATDTIGQTGSSSTISLTVELPPTPPGIHAADLDFNVLSTSVYFRFAMVTVAVESSEHAPVGGARVDASFSNGRTGYCYTSSSGSCIIRGVFNTNTDGNSGSMTLTNIASPGGYEEYTPGHNHDPDGDSTGTTIEFDL